MNNTIVKRMKGHGIRKRSGGDWIELLQRLPASQVRKKFAAAVDGRCLAFNEDTNPWSSKFYLPTNMELRRPQYFVAKTIYYLPGHGGLLSTGLSGRSSSVASMLLASRPWDRAYVSNLLDRWLLGVAS